MDTLKASSSLPLCCFPSPAPAYVNKSKMLVASKGITWLWLSTTLPTEWVTAWLAIVEVHWSGGCVNVETCRLLIHDAFFCDLIVAVLMFWCTFHLLISCNWRACPYPPIPPTVFLTCGWSIHLRLELFNYCALNVADIWNNNVLYHAEPRGCLYRGWNVSSQQLLVIVKFPVDSVAQRMVQVWAPILTTCLRVTRGLLRAFCYMPSCSLVDTGVSEERATYMFREGCKFLWNVGSYLPRFTYFAQPSNLSTTARIAWSRPVLI